MLPPFSASADFALDKPAGVPCPHLASDARCGIHAELGARGFPGCVVFDCFGAGQHVTQAVLPGVDWRAGRDETARLAAVFPAVRQLRELLWYLAEAAERLPPGPLREQVQRVRAETDGRCAAPPAVLAALDLAAERRAAGDLLGRVSAALRLPAPVRAAGRSPRRRGGLRRAPSAGADLAGSDLAGRDLTGADLVGARLRGADLRSACLRGAYLLGADLSGADLTRTDLLGADLRGADVRGARLAEAVFLTGPQAAAARGDAATTLPAALGRPAAWSR